MNKITKYLFSQLYDMASGISSTKEQAGHGRPFVSFSTVFNNYFLPDTLPDLMDTSAQEQETYSIKEGDILITRTSETIDELAMSCVATKDYPRATYSGFTKRLRPKTEGIAYHKYLAFYLRGKLFRKTVTNNAFMTLRASFNEDIFSFLHLYLPEYEEQVKIGDLLYAIEQKMQLNKRVCTELESMAKTIYDYWFTQFDFPNAEGKPYRSSGGEMIWDDKIKCKIPIGWTVQIITEIANLYQPQTISNDLLDNSYDHFVYGGGGMIGRYSKYNHEESEIILSCRGNCGNVYMTMPKSWITGNAMVINPTNRDKKEYLYYFLKRYGVEKYITGSVQKQLTRENLSSMPIIIPDDDIIKQFDVIAHLIRQKQQKIEMENIELTKLRDWLLPMLMNGQATVE